MPIFGEFSKMTTPNEFNISQELEGVFEWFWYKNEFNTQENTLEV